MAGFNIPIKDIYTYDPSILLHPTIPKQLHTVNPRTILGQKWWNEQRQKVYEEKDYHCHACSVHKTQAKFKPWLEAHEFYTIDYSIGEVSFDKIVALCHSCHNYIHINRLTLLLESGKINKYKYDYITRRGQLLLAQAGLAHRPNYPDTSHLGWGDWHMIVEGKKYFSPFKDEAGWTNHFKESK